MPGIVEEDRIGGMHAAAEGVALQDHRLDVVIEHLARHAAKGGKRCVAADQRLEPLIIAELHVRGPAPPQRGDVPLTCCPDSECGPSTKLLA